MGGTSWSASFVALIFSVQLQTPLGDVAALTSGNVVLAALLGRIFLGEELRWCHLASVLCSILGALLISKPDIFVGGRTTSAPVAGFVLAAASGFFDACILICSRKSAKTSSWFHSLSAEMQSSLVFLLLTYSPFVDRIQFAPILAEPFQAVGWIAALFTLDTLNIVVYCTAAQWCPAGLSATVNTAANMVVGYMVQVIFFGTSAEPTTVIGASMMLLGVVAMACVREPGPALDLAVMSEPANNSSVAMEDDETESMGSFAASEFVDQEPQLRKRTSTAAAASTGSVDADTAIGKPAV